MDIGLLIVKHVASSMDTDPSELSPLYHTIDPGALSEFVKSANTEAAVDFHYCGHRITVKSDGSMKITEKHPPPMYN